GEDKNWSSKVTVKKNNGEERYQIQINYIGHNIREIEIFSYYVETKNTRTISFGGDHVTLNKEGIYQKDLLISNSPSTTEKDELVINIEWNGSNEGFILINK